MGRGAQRRKSRQGLRPRRREGSSPFAQGGGDALANSARERKKPVDAKVFWNQMEDSKVDLIFEQVQKVLSSLKQKIKDGTATNEECYQALALVNQVDRTDVLPWMNDKQEALSGLKDTFQPEPVSWWLRESSGAQREMAQERDGTYMVPEPEIPHPCFKGHLSRVARVYILFFKVNNAVAEEDRQKCEPGLHPSASREIAGNPGDYFSSRMEIKETIHSRSKGEPTEMSSKLLYRDHVCSKQCLARRPWNSYRGENPLNLPILCHFQRWHAKADSVSKSHDVIYKAPCGRSLRNFQDVQNYLFQTECSFLCLDHFSFNTYVQVFRNIPFRQAFVFDFDISKGAETVPVSFCNDIGHDHLPYFKYRKVSWPHGYFLNNFSSMFFDSCSCTDGCTDKTKCACLLLTERNCCEVSVTSGKETSNGYNYKRLDGPIPSGIYECSLLCSCDKMMCQNRLVQHGLQVRLQVFNTEKKGWGVRCLDDIDKGTFVCTYSGRLMSKDESREPKDGDDKVEEEVTENSDRSHSLFPKKRKLGTVCYDSEIEFIQTTGKKKSLHVKAGGQPTVIQNNNYNSIWSYQGVTRPKTRTSILQSHRRQLGITDASSDEEESPMCQESRRRKAPGTAKKGDGQSSLQEEFGEMVSTLQSEGNKENPLSNTTLNSKPAGQDDGWIKKQCKDLFWTDSTRKENIRKGREELAHNKEAIEDNETHLKNKENPCLLDATREGNVGRFLNVSNSATSSLLQIKLMFCKGLGMIISPVAHKRCVRVLNMNNLQYSYSSSRNSVQVPPLFLRLAFFLKKNMSPCQHSRHPSLQEVSERQLDVVTPSTSSASAGFARAGLQEDMFSEWEKAIRPPQQEVKELATQVKETTQVTVEVKEQGMKHKAAIKALSLEHNNIKKQIADLEDRSRRQNLRKPNPDHVFNETSLQEARLGLKVLLGRGSRRFSGGSPFGRRGARMARRRRGKAAAGDVGRALQKGPRELLQTARCRPPEPRDFAKQTRIMAKMVKRQCAFCPEDEECAIMYVAEGQNLAVHQDCLLYSSGFVESEEHNPENLDIRFDVASVMNEIKRGKRLICNFCRKKGATVGCEIKHCRRSYHYFCALCDDAAIETDEMQGIYRVFCPNHDPVKKTSFYDEDKKKGRSPIIMKSSSARQKMSDKETVAEESLHVLKKKHDRHKVRIDILRKCKQAGLLDEIFEEMLDTLHLAQEKLMDDNTSEAEYEETVISLFDCGLFENILTAAHSGGVKSHLRSSLHAHRRPFHGTEEKIQQLLNTRKRLDTQIEFLKDLKEVVLPATEDTASVSNSISE
ncbi:histone-lysine N-methyltransferase SETDB2 [Rhineura floridana]|uniref:histone-lysine N-methyltransferase SETDB2 n=1 Tax=Rhineura floridana TaxID=261503 RepID=UPI002AC81AD6|nr:histone-lysine N-methyltransferase SETDB2 [Rhineura floridana]